MDQFADFVNQVGKLGEATNNKTESEDVTDKYYDFQVRIDDEQFRSTLEKIIRSRPAR